VAVVPEKLAGCYDSSEFPTFLPKPDKLIPEWFHLITKTKPFWEQCDEKSRGTSGQNRIRPEKFLVIKIPLPPVEEQRRIVARIEALAGKIEEARGLRREANEEAPLLLTLASKSPFERPTADQISMEGLVGRANLKNGKSIKTDGVPSGIKCLRLSAMRNGRVDCADAKSVPM